MTQMYGHRFTSVWGSEDLGAWQTIIFSFTTFIVTEALCFLLNKDHPFMEFPPNPMQFRKLCESIKAEHTPRKASKLTAPCDTCGKPGRTIIKEGLKATETLCYDHYYELRVLTQFHVSQKSTHDRWTLDKIKIREQLEAKNYKGDIDREVENLFLYHTMRHETVAEASKMVRHNYENG